MIHNFHHTIYKVLDIDVAPGRFVWDAACGGSQLVSLFREVTKSRSRRYACADAVLIVDSSVRLILEIEEAGANGFLPARIAGKLTTSALCRSFIARGRAQPVRFGRQVVFAQIVNCAGLKQGSRKLDQYSNMERDIRERLMPLGSITDYRLIAGDVDAFLCGYPGAVLRQLVTAVVGPNRKNLTCARLLHGIEVFHLAACVAGGLDSESGRS